MEKISEHVTYGEIVRSEIAKRFHIDNAPNEQQLQNIKILMVRLFEPLRTILGNKPLFLSSVFRSKALNIHIGGAKDSQHMANYGAAMDIDDDAFEDWPQNEEVFWGIFDNLDFDQLIWEEGDKKRPAWVHVSYVSPEKNRREVLYFNGEKYVEFKQEEFIRPKAA